MFLNLKIETEYLLTLYLDLKIETKYLLTLKIKISLIKLWREKLW